MHGGGIRQLISGAGQGRASHFDSDVVGQYVESILVTGVISQVNGEVGLFAQMTIDPTHRGSLVPVRARHNLKNLPARIHSTMRAVAGAARAKRGCNIAEL